MHKTIFLLALFVSINSISAQESNQEKAIKNVISTFFDGLHKGDSAIMSKALHKDIKIQTIAVNREGLKRLVTQPRKALLTGIANKKPEHKYYEKLLSYEIKIDGDLASVWTPYEFYFNDNFSHCGANSFQLFNNNGSWQITYIVDTRRRENCNVKKAKK